MTTKETSPSKTSTLPKRRGTRFWAVCAVLVLGMPLLFYYGYCWGLWGRHSLLLQYLFQCSCPPASEEARYPKNVDVIVSACRQSYVELSPSGRLLAVHEEQDGLTSTYLLDLQSMERTEITNQPFSSFLTDNLGFIESGLEDTIIDRTTGRQYPIQAFSHWRDDAYVNGEPNLDLLVSALHRAEQVFLTLNYSTVVVLMPNFFANPAQSFTFDLFDFPMWDSNEMEQFLRENKVSYRTVLASFPDEVISPDERFVARADGIYLNDTNQKIVGGYSFSRFFRAYSGKWLAVRGWTYDSSGVIYSQFTVGPCLIEIGMMDGVGCFYEVPQPVLKLKVPEKYLLP
jgi:hypothetical protein